MKADKGQQSDKGHSTSLRSSQGNHTPGPWSARHLAPNVTDIVGGDGVIANVARFTHGLPGTVEENEANARRIVACVNYCEGVSTAELEAAPKNVNLRAILNALDSAAHREEIVAILAEAYAKP